MKNQKIGKIRLTMTLVASLTAFAVSATTPDEIVQKMQSHGYTNISVEKTLLGNYKVTGYFQGRLHEIVINRNEEVIRSHLEDEADGGHNKKLHLSDENDDDLNGDDNDDHNDDHKSGSSNDDDHNDDHKSGSSTDDDDHDDDHKSGSSNDDDDHDDDHKSGSSNDDDDHDDDHKSSSSNDDDHDDEDDD